MVALKYFEFIWQNMVDQPAAPDVSPETGGIIKHDES